MQSNLEVSEALAHALQYDLEQKTDELDEQRRANLKMEERVGKLNTRCAVCFVVRDVDAASDRLAALQSELKQMAQVNKELTILSKKQADQ